MTQKKASYSFQQQLFFSNLQNQQDGFDDDNSDIWPRKEAGKWF
jgi:hypothetical protein